MTEKAKIILATIVGLAILTRLFDGIFNILLLVFPVLPIFYGCITGKKGESILVGVLPFLVVSLTTSSIMHLNLRFPIWGILRTLALLGIIPGIEGYFAARRRVLSLLIAIFLCILWFQIIICGLH